MLDEIAVDLFHNRSVELFQQYVVVFLGRRELEFIFFGISDDILADQVLQFVPVLQVRELADYAVDSVDVEVFQQFLQVGSNLRVNNFAFRISLLLGGRFCGFLQELLVLFLDHDSSFSWQSQVFVGSNDHTFNDIFFQLRQSQQWRNGGVKHCIHIEDFVKGSLDVDRDMCDVILEQFRNIQYIHPVIFVFRNDANVESKELVVRCVVDSFLNWFGFTFDIVWIFDRPITTEVLTIDGELDHLGVIFLDIFVDIRQSVVEAGHQLLGIIKGFIEILARVFARDRNFLSQEISSPTVAGGLSVVEDREVRSVDFFRSNPQYFLIVVAFCFDKVDKLVSSGKLQGGVLVKFQLFVLSDYRILFVLHQLQSKQFFYITFQLSDIQQQCDPIISDHLTVPIKNKKNLHQLRSLGALQKNCKQQ